MCIIPLKGYTMLSNKTISLLNTQVNDELFSANLYMNMSSWCYFKGFDGAGLFLREHASEESHHGQKIVNYLNETGAQSIIGQIDATPHEFKDLLDVFTKTYAHEQKITKSINDLLDHVLEEKDYATFNFLQWYVNEQHEEETLFKGILDKLHLLDKNDNGLYMADRYILSLAGKA